MFASIIYSMLTAMRVEILRARFNTNSGKESKRERESERQENGGEEEERDGIKSNSDSRQDGAAAVLIKLEKICSNENISCIIFQLLNSNF